MRQITESFRRKSQTVSRQTARLCHCLDRLNGFWEVIGLCVVLFVALNVASLLLLPLLYLLNISPFQLSIGSWVLLQWDKGDSGFGITFSQWTLGAISIMTTLLTISIRRFSR